MPEQNEWQPDNDNANDYRWHPHYARLPNGTTSTAGVQAPAYDTRTLADKVRGLETELRILRALLLMREGEL